MSANATLRERALEAIRAGRLPCRSPERTWAGWGCGASCAICGERVHAEELEFELQFALGDGRRSGDYHVHRGCFLAWTSELQELESRQGTVRATDLPGLVAEVSVPADGREAPSNRGPE